MGISKVLVVDDSAVELESLKGIVTDLGCAVITASSGAEALEKAEQHPDIVFLDIVMDNIDGYKVCRRMRKLAHMKDKPIIFVSSKNQPADKLWAKNQGGTDFITKPYQANEIIDQIKSHQASSFS